MKKSGEFIQSILKLFITIILVFMSPFILPIGLKIFLKLRVFESIEEFENIIKTFYNVYPFLSILIMILLLLWFFHKWGDIKEYVQEHNIKLRWGNNELSTSKIAEEVIQENQEKKKVTEALQQSETDKSSRETIEEAKNLLFMTEKKVEEQKKENIEELEKENEILRYYAAYNIINKEAKCLLHIIYNENYVEKARFRKDIIDGYTRRNKRNNKFSKTDLKNIANNKYDEIFDGLKFLDIIELSEDDKEVKLTKKGKEFVKYYIEREEVV